MAEHSDLDVLVVWRRAEPEKVEEPANQQERDRAAHAGEIIDAINAGSLDYRVGSVYGTPWFRLLRREVEHLVEVRRGRPYLDQRRAKAELAKVDADLTRLRGDVAVLEERRSKLLAELTG